MKCPKCDAEIARFDLSPNCKKCGAHILYYTQEEDLKRDAQKTELEFASARILVAKLKAAFIGGKLPIVRAVLMLVTVLSLVLPVFDLKISLPWWEQKISVGAIGVYSLVTDSFLSVLGDFLSIGAGKSLLVVTVVTFVLFLITVLLTIALLALFIVSFVSLKKTAMAMTVISAVGAVLSAAETVLSFIATGMSADFTAVTVSVFYGSVFSLIVFTLYAVINAMILRDPPETVIAEADKKRIEIKKMLKSGEITLDDLSLPVIEDEKKEEKNEKKGKKQKRGKKK
ncbi:MAG: hypothetical protein IJA39_03575 [Clostridia bacterium]|nr:hypothetical protein [Clostridia bacterium]